VTDDQRRTRVLDKIKKCLALSKSANEHEAAAALRQAQVLMRQHNLTQAGVEASSINRASANAGAAYRPTKWDESLVVCVAAQFACQALLLRPRHQQVRWLFLGSGQNPEVAAYTYHVLRRQLLEAKRQFVSKNFPDASPGSKRKLGGLFCMGWVEAVATIVASFAHVPDAEHTAALAAYMQQHHPDAKDKKQKARTRQVSQVEYAAYRHGLEQGGNAQLHRGVSGSGQALLEGYETPPIG